MLAAADEFFAGIPGVTWVRPAGGLYVWMSLPERHRDRLQEPAVRRGRQAGRRDVRAGRAELRRRGRPRNQMRLSFGVQTAGGDPRGDAAAGERRAGGHVG